MTPRGPTVYLMPRTKLRQLQSELAAAASTRSGLTARIEALRREIRALDARVDEIRASGVTPDASGRLEDQEVAELRRLREAEQSAAVGRRLTPEARRLDDELLRLVEDGAGQRPLQAAIDMDRSTVSRRVARALRHQQWRETGG